MGGYNKFNVVFYINGVEFVDCRAFYLKENGQIQRVGANENNNVENCLDENEVELIALSLNIPFSSLKTEEEIQPKTQEIIM